MEYRILGSGPGFPEEDKHLSCIYIHYQEKHLLLDCGEGCSQHVLRQGIGKNVLDAVAISHYHPDHFSGLFMLVQTLYLQDRCRDLHLYLPEREEEVMRMLEFQYTFPERMCFKIKVHNISQLDEDYPFITTMQTDHLLGYRKVIQAKDLPNQMRSWAFKIGTPGKTLIYTADLQTTDCISPLFDGCHSIIVDAMHPSKDQILRLRDLGFERIILNHGLSQDLQTWLQENPEHGFEFSREDISYCIEE